MLKQILFILLVGSLVLISGCGQPISQPNQNSNQSPKAESEAGQNSNFIVGGPCSYDQIRGNCKIVSVAKTSVSKQQAEISGGPGYEGFEVKFTFSPENEADLKGQEFVLNKENLLMLTNSWYPGPEYLAKYNIKEQAVFACGLDLIVRGTCTPIIYKFDSIDRTDYFETKK